VSQFGERDTIS